MIVLCAGMKKINNELRRTQYELPRVSASSAQSAFHRRLSAFICVHLRLIFVSLSDRIREIKFGLFPIQEKIEPANNNQAHSCLNLLENKPQIMAPRVTSLPSRASGGRIHVCLRAYVGTKSRSVAFGVGVSTSTVTPVDCVHTYASALAYVDERPQGAQPLTYAPQGIRVRGVENPQGFGIDERRFVNLNIQHISGVYQENSLTESMQSSVIPVATYEKATASRFRTRMTRIGRIFTDIFHSCASLFHSPDNKPQRSQRTQSRIAKLCALRVLCGGLTLFTSWITRIFTNPCASVSSVLSVFYCHTSAFICVHLRLISVSLRSPQRGEP